MIPPAAITGTRTRSRTCGTSAIVPTSAASNGPPKVPRCPPASLPWATTASQPTASRVAASSVVVAVPITVTPASASAEIASVGGTPKVMLKTDGGRSSRTSSCASNGGDGVGGACPGPSPRRSRHGAIRSSIPATAAGASGVRSGANRLTAKGSSVSRRTAASCSRSASGDRIAAPREPSAPASETAATSSGVLTAAIGAWISG